MARYRITKYNPANRDKQGAYLDRTEWISISDIVEPQSAGTTCETYEKVETAYVEAVKAILRAHAIDFLKIGSFEHRNAEADFKEDSSGRLRELNVSFSEIEKLQNGTRLPIERLEKIIRLILREVLWMTLLVKGIKVEFGYDYYMYVKCPKLTQSLIEQIEKSGLFIESIG